MRTSITAALLGISSVAMGWSIALYAEEECNDAANLSYMIVDGTGETPHCIGPGAKDELPEGVTCTFYGDGGNFNEPCNGQIKTFKSWRVTRGEYWFWGTYDESPSQALDLKCGDFIKFNKEEVFKQEDRCRNAWFHRKLDVFGVGFNGEKVHAPIQGITAWDAASQ